MRDEEKRELDLLTSGGKYDSIVLQTASRCGGTVYASVSKTDPARVEGSNLSTGILRLPLSMDVDSELKFLPKSPQRSPKICCHLLALLSVLLSAKIE